MLIGLVTGPQKVVNDSADPPNEGKERPLWVRDWIAKRTVRKSH